jgi:serine/threonine protein kinase
MSDDVQDADLIQPDTELAGYRIVRFVARGGMGSVYEAIQLSLDRRVALKFISRRLGDDERFRERFRREARSGAAIDHPNILPVYEAGELPDGSLFLALRFVDGPDLKSLLGERGPLDVPETVGIMTQVADALDAAHERKLVHRDVKPANVLLESHERGWHAYLADFGLAKPNEDPGEHTQPGEMLGTVDYMAPEQIDGGPLDGRADVYSFGCMVYRCLTGESPYKRETPTATLVAHANAAVPVPSDKVPGLPNALDIVVARAMEKNPDKRAPSAGALMHWAASQLQLDTVAPPAGEEQPWPDAVAEPGAAAARLRQTLRVGLLAAVAYTPIWVVTYLLGRSL